MDIANDMFDHYLQQLTRQWPALHEPRAEEQPIDEGILQTLRSDAEQHNDLYPLRLAIDRILLHPGEYSLDDHGKLPYDAEEVGNILRCLRHKLYPDAAEPNPQEVQAVRIVTQSRFDWWEQRALSGDFDPSKVLSQGPALWLIELQQAVQEGRKPRLRSLLEEEGYLLPPE